MLRRLCWLFAIFAASNLDAMEIELVVDLTTENFSATSQPTGFVRVGDRYFFLATTPQQGRQIWRTDLSESGTIRITEGNEGSRAYALVELNGELFYTAGARDSHGDGVQVLRASNGEFGGSRPVASFRADEAAPPIVFDGWIWLMVRTSPAAALELWRSDGTTTELFLESSGVREIPEENFLIRGDELFFNWHTEETGFELWRTDGTRAGTEMVVDLNPGPVSSFLNLGRATIRDGLLYFDAYDGSSSHLFRSDGTASGTEQILEEDVDDPSYFYGDYALFRARRTLKIADLTQDPVAVVPFPEDVDPIRIVGLGSRLLVFDRSESGTSLVSLTPKTGVLEEILTGSAHSEFLLEVVGSHAIVGITHGDGPDLFRTDGSPEGTTPLADFGDKVRGVVSSSVVEDVVFFAPDDEEIGAEPWVSDGTSEGTHLLKNVADDTVTASSDPRSLAWVDGALFFGAGIGRDRGLWRWNESEGASLVALAPDGAGTGWKPNLAAFQGAAYFAQSAALWKVTGRGVATLVFQTPFIGNLNSLFVAREDLLYFRKGSTLYVTDGGSEYTLIGGGGGGDILGGAFFDGRLFYTAENFETGRELWVSRGTAEETRIVADLAPGTNDSRIEFVEASAFGVVFATLVDNEWTLWTTDGSPGSTQPLINMEVDIRQRPLDVASAPAGIYFFLANTLWWSDGSGSGTFPVRELPHRADFTYFGSQSGPNAAILTESRNQTGLPTMIFSLNSPDAGAELWITNGSAQGTKMLADLEPGVAHGDPKGFITNGREAFFVAESSEHGDEIWRSDGTSEGTFPITDIRPGSLSSNVSDLLLVDDVLYFIADDGLTGREIWRTFLEPSICSGDCDGDGRVTISELVTNVRIALGHAELNSCTAVDTNGNGLVAIAELIAAVNRALRGC